MTASLARCVGDVDGFLADSFGRTHHLHHGGPFDDVLDLTAVDAALTHGGLRRPAVRLVRDGTVVDPSTWTRRARTGAVTVDDVADPARVLDAFADGTTVVLQSLHRWCPPVAAFCRDLEATLTHAVQANAYLTPAGAAGLADHHDTHDVFVLQLHGTKRWTVRTPLVEAPLPRHRSDPARAARQPVVLEVELAPGDCLYLPRGTVHAARSQAATSLHLTIGVLATTAADVVRRVAELAGDVPALRRALPPGWADDPAAAERVVREALDELVATIGGLVPAAIAADLAERFRAGRRTALTGQLLQLDALDAVDDASTVVARPGLVWSAARHDDRLHVTVAGRVLDLPAAVEPAVRRLLDGRPLRVADLADQLDGPSRLVLVRRLVREGLVRTEGIAGG